MRPYFKTVLTITLLQMTLFLNAQSIEKTSLRLYNDYLNNPSLLTTKKTFQLNLYGWSNFTKIKDHPKEYMINAIYSFKKINSSISASFYDENLGKLIRNQGIRAGYAYNHKITQKLIVSIGAELDFFKHKFNIPNNFIGIPPYEVNGVNYILSMGLKFKNLSFAYSLHKYITSNSDTNAVWFNETKFSNSVFFKYKISIKEKWNITPQLMYCENFQPYFLPAITLDYNEITGLGIDYMDGFNITAFVRIKETVKFIFLIKEKDLNLIYDKNSGWNLLGQLQIDI